VLHGLNLLGLQRRGFAAEIVRDLKRAYRLMFRSGLTVGEAGTRIRAEVPASPQVERFVAFIQASSGASAADSGRVTAVPGASGGRGGGGAGKRMIV